MRNRLAIHFGFVAFAVIWGLILFITRRAEVPVFLGSLVFGVMSALIGWLAASDAGRGWTMLRVIGWTPIVCGVMGTVLALLDHSYTVLADAAASAAGSVVLLPLYLAIAAATSPTENENFERRFKISNGGSN